MSPVIAKGVAEQMSSEMRPNGIARHFRPQPSVFSRTGTSYLTAENIPSLECEEGAWILSQDQLQR